MTDEDRPGLGGGLQARRHVGRVAERDRLRIGGCPRAPTAARPLLTPTRTANPVIPQAASMSRAYRSTTSRMRRAVARGALGVVLVGGRNAEVRADPVALVRLHRAAVLVDRAAHHRHALADEHLGLVRLEPLAERRRADDVGEENRDGTALVLA